MRSVLGVLSVLSVWAVVAASAGPAWAQDEEAEQDEPAAAEAEAEPEPEPEPEPPAEPLPAGATAELPEGPEEAKALLGTAMAMTPEQRAQYAELLRQVVKAIRGKVMAKMTAKIEAKQAAKMDKLGLFLGIFSLCGFLLLLLPLKLKRRYPGQGRLLFKYSALAALLFFLAVNLFATVMFTMRGAQGLLGQQTNPQLEIVDSSFDVIHDNADDLVDIGPMLIEPTLIGLTDPESVLLDNMLGNVQKIQAKLTIFKTLGSMFKKVDWLFGMLPIFLMGLAILLFVRTAMPTLKEIIGLPERAASTGHHGVARSAVGFTLRNVWAEAKAAIGTIGVLMCLTLLAGAMLGIVLKPALEVFIAYLSLDMIYTVLVEDASVFWIGFSLVGAMLFLVINLAVVILTTGFFMGKAQQAFQAKFREGVPLRAQKRLWTWGSLSAAWSLVLPVLYVLVADKVIGWLAVKGFERHFDTTNPADSNWGIILGSGPALFILTFVAVFWAAQGGRALGFLARYRIVRPAPTQRAPHVQPYDTEPFPQQHAA